MGSPLIWDVVCKLGFVGEIDLCTFLSVSREKYQKSATQGRPPGASLTEPTTCVRMTPSPTVGRRSLIARKVADTR